MNNEQKNTSAKPFLKWAGGKTQLLHTIDLFLPKDLNDEQHVTYIEPFVGGGAMLFFMLQRYSNIKKAIINDINPHLITTYRVVKEKPFELIEKLRQIESFYKSLNNNEKQQQLFLNTRAKFNTESLTDVKRAAYMIFLNRTCFNGLYRENSKGQFNVPFGKYKNPGICDEELIIKDSQILQNVEIIQGDYTATLDKAYGYTFFYFDPPYRPLDATSSFNSYSKTNFDDREQIRLKEFFDRVTKMGHKVLLSNSDCKGRNPEDLFFDNLYQNYKIERVLAKRSINANPQKRGTLTELLIRNYSDTKTQEYKL